LEFQPEIEDFLPAFLDLEIEFFIGFFADFCWFHGVLLFRWPASFIE
jgi:hypothetical protein